MENSTTVGYLNFDLLITPSANGYTAHAIDSPVGEITATFTLDFTPAELRSFFWLSGRALRHFRHLQRASPRQATLAQRSINIRWV